MHNDLALRVVKRTRPEEPDPLTAATQYLQREALPPGNVEKLRSLNAVARSRFKVARSHIHGWGLFVWPKVTKPQARGRGPRAWPTGEL